MKNEKQYREPSEQELLLDISTQLSDLSALMHAQLVAQARILAHLTTTSVETVRAELMQGANAEGVRSLEQLWQKYELPPASDQPK